MLIAIVDIEATCDDFEDLRFKNEIIEIGAVLYDTERMKFRGEFDAFVRPTWKPKLTDFCTRLTTIRQEDVDEAETLDRVIVDFGAWADGALFCSWGNYDRNQMRRECAQVDARYPFDDRHVNLKYAFARLRGLQAVGYEEAMRIAGLEMEGTQHRGIWDAINLGKMVDAMVRGGWDPNQDVRKYSA